MSTKSELDKYYFKHNLGKKWVVAIIKENPGAKVFIEPSGGDGAFSNPLHALLEKGKKCIAIDIKPEASNIIKCDFFAFPWKKYTLPKPDKIVSVVSAPFGKRNQFVYKFFNDCAKRSDIIYLICSRVFKKPHTHKKLNDHFHMEYSTDLSKDSFTLNGNTYKLRCCIQKWVRKKEKRKVKLKYKSNYFKFAESEQPYDFAIGRVNKSAGKVLDNISVYKHKKNILFIKINPKYKNFITHIKKNINLEKEANNTILSNSVTRYEVVSKIESMIKKSY